MNEITLLPWPNSWLSNIQQIITKHEAEIYQSGSSGLNKVRDIVELISWKYRKVSFMTHLYKSVFDLEISTQK